MFDASTLRRFARGRAGPPRRSLTPTLVSFPVRLQSFSFAAKSLLARAGAPERQCSVPGGALHVLSDPSAAVQVFRRDDLVLALRADGVTLEQFVAAYDATAGSANGDTRARVNAIRDAAVVRNGEVVVRKMMYLSPSFDHRVIDGAVGARFIAALKQVLENPEALLLELS